MADLARETYADPATAAVLLAAEEIQEQVYEMDRRVSPGLQAVFQSLAEAVYQWHESRELQDENEAEGIRAGAVADLADPTFAATYAVSVHRVIVAAQAVRAAVATDEPPAVAPEAAPMLRGLDKALDRWREQPDLAASWRNQGARPVVVHSDHAGPPSPEPPRTPAPALGGLAETATTAEDGQDARLNLALEPGDGSDSAAYLAAELTPALPTSDDRATPQRPSEAPAPSDDDEGAWDSDDVEEVAAYTRGAFLGVP